MKISSDIHVKSYTHLRVATIKWIYINFWQNITESLLGELIGYKEFALSSTEYFIICKPYYTSVKSVITYVYVHI